MDKTADCLEAESFIMPQKVNLNLMDQFDAKSCDNTAVVVQKQGADPLTVYLRVRPLPQTDEALQSSNSCIKVLNEQELITIPPKGSHTHKGLKMGVSDMKTKFSFTRIFDETTGQKVFYESAIYDYIQDFIIGHDVLIFAYGVTNSGKTYTMAGTRQNPGILPRALDSIFQAIEHRHPEKILYKPKGFANVLKLSADDIKLELKEKSLFMRKRMPKLPELYSDTTKVSEAMSSQVSMLTNLVSTSDGETDIHTENNIINQSRITSDPLDLSFLDLEQGEMRYSIWVSFAEIHNENIYDLLDCVKTSKEKPQKKIILKLADDNEGSVFIKDLKEIECSTAMEALQLFLLGEQQRRVGETKLNLHSSRSHAIFSLRCIKTDCNNTPTRVNTLSLIDLAGSERQISSKAEGQRLKEAGSINQSLHILGRCINTMRSNQNKQPHLKRIVPFRDSKLTRIFQSYLIGKSEYEGKLTMIVNISQDENTFDETCHALKFSAVAREVIPVTMEPRNTLLSLATISDQSCLYRKESDIVNRTELYQESLLEVTINQSMIDELCLTDLKSCCHSLLEIKDTLINMITELKIELSDTESKIRAELNPIYESALTKAKEKYENYRVKDEERLNDYHEKRMEIVQKSIKKERFRARRSRSVDDYHTPQKATKNTDSDNDPADQYDVSKMADFERKFNKLQQEYNARCESDKLLEAEKSQLASQLKSTQENLKTTENKCKQLENSHLKIRFLTNDLDKANSEIRSLNVTKESLQSDVEALLTSNMELNDELTSVRNELKTVHNNSKIKDKTIESIKSDNNELIETRSELENQANELKNTISRLEGRITELQTTRSAQEKIHLDQIRELEEATKQQQSLQLQFREFKEKHFEERTFYENRISELETALKEEQNKPSKVMSNLKLKKCPSNRSLRISLPPSNHTYMSMTNTDEERHYESIHSSQFRDTIPEDGTVLAPETVLLDTSNEIASSYERLLQAFPTQERLNIDPNLVIPETVEYPTTNVSAASTTNAKEDSFESYTSIRKDGPIYENLQSIQARESVTSELIDQPASEVASKIPVTVHINPPNQKKRKSEATAAPTPPPRKRNKASRLFSQLSITNTPKIKGPRTRLQSKITKNLPSIPTPPNFVVKPVNEKQTRSPFKLFPGSFKISKKDRPEIGPSTEEVISQKIYVNDSMKDHFKKVIRSKNKGPRKSQISAPLETMHLPIQFVPEPAQYASKLRLRK